MILILSNNEVDLETDYIIKWLKFYKAPYLRLNFDDFINLPFEIGHNFFFSQEKQYLFSDFKTVWVRRITTNTSFDYDNDFDVKSNEIVSYHLKEELESIFKLFLRRFPKKIMVNAYKAYFIDKIEQTEIANSVGLLTADFTISNHCNFDLKNKICKPINNIGYLLYKDSIHSSYTLDMESDDTNFPTNFFPSFFQDKINVKNEIRVMYVNGEFFSTALFYDDEKNIPDLKLRKIRTSKYNLPNNIKTKLKAFFDEINFAIGTVDLIKSTTNKYYFLELNPTGKFLYYSDQCNFNLDQKIAKFLIKHE